MRVGVGNGEGGGEADGEGEGGYESGGEEQDTAGQARQHPPDCLAGLMRMLLPFFPLAHCLALLLSGSITLLAYFAHLLCFWR